MSWRCGELCVFASRFFPSVGPELLGKELGKGAAGDFAKRRVKLAEESGEGPEGPYGPRVVPPVMDSRSRRGSGTGAGLSGRGSVSSTCGSAVRLKMSSTTLGYGNDSVRSHDNGGRCETGATFKKGTGGKQRGMYEG